jgi:hypothetical protein
MIRKGAERWVVFAEQTMRPAAGLQLQNSERYSVRHSPTEVCRRDESRPSDIRRFNSVVGRDGRDLVAETLETAAHTALARRSRSRWVDRGEVGV